jgi:hypothetical protein
LSAPNYHGVPSGRSGTADEVVVQKLLRNHPVRTAGSTTGLIYSLSYQF